MTTSRIANSSWVACDDVVTLFRTTVPASISSASLRRAAMALVSFSPKACFPARSAHSAAWMLVLPPLIMLFFPLTRKKNVLLDHSLLKKFPYTLLTPTSQNRRGNFRIAETANYRPVIKIAAPVYRRPFVFNEIHLRHPLEALVSRSLLARRTVRPC